MGELEGFQFNLKITAHHNFISEFNFQLIKWVFL